MPLVFGPAVGELLAVLSAQGRTPDGAAFAHHFDMSPGIFNFEVGFFVLGDGTLILTNTRELACCPSVSNPVPVRLSFELCYLSVRISTILMCCVESDICLPCVCRDASYYQKPSYRPDALPRGSDPPCGWHKRRIRARTRSCTMLGWLFMAGWMPKPTLHHQQLRVIMSLLRPLWHHQSGNVPKTCGSGIASAPTSFKIRPVMRRT
jgi:hypothetical protein